MPPHAVANLDGRLVVFAVHGHVEPMFKRRRMRRHQHSQRLHRIGRPVGRAGIAEHVFIQVHRLARRGVGDILVGQRDLKEPVRAAVRAVGGHVFHGRCHGGRPFLDLLLLEIDHAFEEVAAAPMRPPPIVRRPVATRAWSSSVAAEAVWPRTASFSAPSNSSETYNCGSLLAFAQGIARGSGGNIFA